MTATLYKVSTSGQVSLPADARHRWQLDAGGPVEVLDLGYAVMYLPVGGTAELFDDLLSKEEHYAFVAALDDPDLATT